MEAELESRSRGRLQIRKTWAENRFRAGTVEMDLKIQDRRDALTTAVGRQGP